VGDASQELPSLRRRLQPLSVLPDDNMVLVGIAVASSPLSNLASFSADPLSYL